MQNSRIFVGGTCVAAVTLITTSWPDEWPGWLRLIAIVVLAFLSVILIEIERRGERAAARKAAAPPEPSGHTGPERRESVPVPRPRPDPSGPAVAASPASVWPTPVKPELAEPLPNKESFRGREAELEDLLRRHASARARAADSAAGGGGLPVLLLMHGKPGVGKSVLAQELARKLADEYPDGQLYANLGNAGDALSSGDVLKSFLGALRWPGAMPEKAVDRASIFRTLTAGKRVLFILDAARDHRQVLDVLPNESRCAAIVTSRRDLGPNLGVSSRLLEVPDADDALEMLQAAARSQEHATPPIVEIVESCGRLPLAMQSAGERVSQEGSNLVSVATLLRQEDSRLERLTRLGRNVEEGFATEYRQLDQAEQRALRVLGMVE